MRRAKVQPEGAKVRSEMRAFDYALWIGPSQGKHRIACVRLVAAGLDRRHPILE